MGQKQKESQKTEKTEFEQNAKEQYFKVFDGSELRVLSFENPPNSKENIEIMFISGLLTIFPRWEKVVKELNEHYKVHYIESREKATSKLVKKAPMKIEIMREDLDSIEKALNLDKKQYITISSSMGGAMILENLAKKAISPIGSILISPGVEVIFPKWSTILIPLVPAFGISMLKPLVRWYLRNKTVDSEKEPEQAKQYIRSVNEADVKKMKKCIVKNANKYDGWDILPKIQDRIILVGATTDKAHRSDFSFRVANALTNCTFVDLGTNKAAHDTPLVELTKDFIKELTNTGPKLEEKIINPEFRKHH
ncbi:MAG: hypothetical protein EAX90_14685 [Candidatus Heimdallarchaeota archaeon]|nr:hypothetical protein [Candidatus Heimdallarchaeota archaeon]